MMHLVILMLCVWYLCALSHTSRKTSYTKWGGIFLDSCENATDIFPLHKHPSLWKSCDDAYTYTWTLDEPNALSHLSETQKLKLIRSTGYCPHRRCQLGNITNQIGHNNSDCPPNLCYTKLEDGSPSFGACCYSHGVFHSGDLIGYYYKSQPQAKPIYKHSRIRLAEDEVRQATVEDTGSETSFINANEVLPGLILTQCPLCGYPTVHHDTLLDVHRMMLQENISLWIQLMPRPAAVTEAGAGKSPSPSPASHSLGPDRSCQVFPLTQYMHRNRTEYTYSRPGQLDVIQVQDIQIGPDPSAGTTMHPKLTSLRFTLAQSRFRPMSEDLDSRECLIADTRPAHLQRVQYIYYSDWNDFDIPPEDDEEAIIQLALLAVAELVQGHKVAISCTSGRGRSGTLAAIISSYLYIYSQTHSLDTILPSLGLLSHDILIDGIVEMRRHRDGLVELPVQYLYISKLLQLVE